MKIITDWFLNAKHWQLFTLLVGLPVLFQFVVAGVTIANIGSGSMGAEGGFSLFLFFPVIMLINVATFFGWFWSIAIGLQPLIPANIKMQVGRFKVFFFMPLAYIAVIIIVLTGAVKWVQDNGQPTFTAIGSMIGIIVPLHLFSMFCLFYCLYFVSKTLRTAQLQREVSFSGFAGEFFLIWFYPIGIWIVQPQINRMVQVNKEDSGSAAN